MLAAHRAQLLARLGDDARVLDIGGWAAPLSRADWVMDMLPYETRGLYGSDPDPERFGPATWVKRDICAREPWPFADGEFDFVVCSHTLEDIRDPVWVCEELARVGRAGYIEVPSRLQEQCWGFEGPWTGWSHHRWLCEVDRAAAAIRFTFKSHTVHAPDLRLPAYVAAGLTAEQAIDWLWWEGGFRAYEHIYTEPAVLTADLRGFVEAHLSDVPAPPAVSAPRRLVRAVRRRLRRA